MIDVKELHNMDPEQRLCRVLADDGWDASVERNGAGAGLVATFEHSANMALARGTGSRRRWTRCGKRRAWWALSRART